MSFPRQDERDAMVDQQIAARGVRDARVLTAMRTVPRHEFIPPEVQAQAYEDHPVSIACGQTISQPYIVAVMTELLALRPQDRVLEIGTGSGYQTAVLAELVREVVSVERHQALAESASACLKRLNFTNVTVVRGDGTQGHADRAPYDAILVTAGSPQTPPALLGQLAEGGRLLCPVGDRHTQRLLKIVRSENRYLRTESLACVFVPLIGETAWPTA